MKKIYTTVLTLFFLATMQIFAAEGIKLSFTRTGTDASSVTISVTDENGTAIDGASATMTTSHAFKSTGNAVTESIICPDVNGNTSPTIKLTFSIAGVPQGFKFNNINTHIHALNGGGNYQETGDGKVRQWNVEAKQGTSESDLATFGSLNNIDIAAGIPGANQAWSIAGSKVTAGETIEIELTITAGTTNSGCFFGLSELALTFEGEDEEETPVTPDTCEYDNIKLGFTRTGTDASSVTISITDENGTAIDGASATMTTSHAFKSTANAVTESIICPNVNGNTSPTIKLTFSITGVPQGFKFNNIGAHIHALNGGSNYQETGDGISRQWNVEAKQGTSESDLATFGSLNNIDIAAGIPGANQVWSIEGSEVSAGETTVIELTITAGTTNAGCFFGLSELALINTEESSSEGEGEGEGTDDSNAKIYNISWKTTGGNYITEGTDQSMYVASYSVTERQFWKFIPTGNENCYYIQNTATGRYIGSCNKTPSSASRISTTTTPVEYYVAPTSATSGEIAGCHYFSSTDCSDYANEANGPRALNKDGASNYVITWQAGTSRVGSYWKLIETEDLYEIRPFEPSSAIGNIEVSYTVNTTTKSITLTDAGVSLTTKDPANDKQGWYFVGTTNREGYLIASSASPTTTIGITDGNITTNTTADTRWKVYATSDASAYYFKSAATGQTLIIDGDSLFTFGKLRNSYARNTQIYNNPCGYLSNNYITQATLTGNDVLKIITYEATSRPSNWHVLYTLSRGEIAEGGNFDIDITLAQSANEYLEVYAYFDWNTDGVFEDAQPMQIDGTTVAGTFTVPAEANLGQSRMRIRVNENALNLAEDDVEGVAYDFIITVSPAMAHRTVTADVNAKGRGTATLSDIADEYTPGTTLTATATPAGSNTFVCWKEGNTIVSTDAEYTFTVDHNIALTAYFTPDTSGSDSPTTGIQAVQQVTGNDITITKEGNTITANASSPIASITIYNCNAALVAKAQGNRISTNNLGNGIYIIKVRARDSEKNFKFLNQ
ncbi:MAG: T9SS type A sorting domain-containing protein [Bacteroidaceae bacterium]|nr:T9SS type A sorting domain-containing protein [Bacteroidaceae bacterium]